MHATSIGRAHLRGDGRRTSARSVARSGSLEWLDEESAMCMSCHDGAVASGSGTLGGMDQGEGVYRLKQGDHPIGVYEISNSSESDGGLRAPSMLDSRVRLFDNQVGCGSCHSLYSANQSQLVMSNDRSDLCLSCHDY